MAAYLMVQMTVSDPAQYQVYSKAVVPLIEKHGGKFIIRGGKVEPLEGRHDGRRMVVFEFPSMEALNRCAASAGGKETLAHAMKISSGGPPVIMVAEEDTFPF